MGYDNDLKAVKIIKNVLVKSVENMSYDHPDIISNDKFGIWATNALSELLCMSAKLIGLEKDMLIKFLNNVWGNDISNNFN